MKGIKIRSVNKARSVFELLGHPIRWIRGSYFGRRFESPETLTYTQMAYSGYKAKENLKGNVDCFCLVGAAIKAYPNVSERHDAIRKLAQAIKRLHPDADVRTEGRISSITDDVIIWNDNLARTWQQVRQVAKTAGV